MKWILTTLLGTAALCLILPAIVQGSVMYGLAVAVICTVAGFVLNAWPGARYSDIALIVLSCIAVSSLFLGIHPLYPALAVLLMVYAWNAAHRFGHLDRAAVDPMAKRQFAIQVLTLSIIPSVTMGLFMIIFLYVRFSLPFGLGLGLSIAALLSIAAFMGLVRAGQRNDD